MTGDKNKEEKKEAKETGELKIKDKEIVVPGEILASGISFLPGKGSYRDGDNVIAEMLGMAKVDGKVIKIIPLSGRYMPKVGDKIIAKIADVLFTGWHVNFNSAYRAMLSVKDATSEFVDRGADITRFFKIGDLIATRIVKVTSQKLIDLTMKGPSLRKLRGGRIIEVNAQKIPRILGKDASMVSMVKFATECDIVVGLNGWIWVNGTPENEIIAVEAIKKIEENAHKTGLTDKIKSFLEKETGKEIKEIPKDIVDEYKDDMDYRPRERRSFGSRGPPRREFGGQNRQRFGGR